MIGVNPVHGLIVYFVYEKYLLMCFKALGTETGTVECWDPRDRSRVGLLGFIAFLLLLRK